MTYEMKSTDYDFRDWLASFKPSQFTVWEMGRYEREKARGPRL